MGVDVDASSAEAFKESFSSSLKDMVKQRLIEAFLESAAMKPLFDQLGGLLGDALRDGIIDAGESAMIDSLVNNIAGAAEPLYDALDRLNAGKEVKVTVDDSSLTDLWAEYDRITANTGREGKQAELREEIRINNTIKDRVKLSMDEMRLERATLLAKKNLTQAERE